MAHPRCRLPDAFVPDPTLTYRVLFDMAAAPATPADVNPMLQTAARYLLDLWALTTIVDLVQRGYVRIGG